MTTAQPESHDHEEDGSIATAEAKYFSDGHPTVMPVKPELTPSNTKIYKSNQFVPQGAPATMIAQPHPHDRVAAIVYSPEELAAMGFEELTVSHSLVDFEHGSAELVPEKRDPKRVVVETSKKLGLALNPQEESAQKEKEFEGAKARLERQMDALEKELKTAYTQTFEKKFPEPETISDETVRITQTVLDHELRSQQKGKLANAISPTLLKSFLETAEQQARKKEIDEFTAQFNADDNFAWEDMLYLAITNSKERYFSCTADVTEPLLQAGIASRTIQLDYNPKHTVTISISQEGDLHRSTNRSTIVINTLHESGESFADRYRKRHPPTRSTRSPR